MFRKIKRYLKDPYFEIGHDMLAKHPNWMSDKWWLSVVWKESMGYALDWKNPKTLNEKLQWLKLYDHNPLYTTLVDKLKVKEYVAKVIGGEHIIPTLAIYKNVDEINIDALPNKFVLKCNHDSGSVVICRDKITFDLDAAKRKLDKAQHFNFYYQQREWPYKYVKPLIFAETYIGEDADVKDYKLFTFNGNPEIVQVDYDRFKEHKRNFYNANVWQYIEMQNEYPNDKQNIEDRPNGLEEMLQCAKTLSASLPFVRMDFYCINKKIYFGEFTLYHGGGFTKFNPQEIDNVMGDWLRMGGLSGGGCYSLEIINTFIFVLSAENNQRLLIISFIVMVENRDISCIHLEKQNIMYEIISSI